MILGEIIQYLPRVRNALDLCSGSGVAALCLSRIAERVDAVEIVPQVADAARINVALADREDRVTVHCGSLYEPLQGQKFDLIIANPPFVPGTWDFAGDPVGAGGGDGLDVARDIWRGARDHLQPSGSLLTLIGMLGGPEAPFVEDELRELAREFGWRIHLLQVQEPMHLERLWVASLIPEDRKQRIRQKLTAGRNLGASHYYVAVLLASPSPVPELVGFPVHPSRSQRMQRSIHELREVRRNDHL